jgi:polysaccharide export outer membrane protein
MVARLPLFLVALAALAADGNKPTAKTDAPAALENYRIGCGDVLQISVWKEPDASVAAAVVRPDGRISMPLLKEVAVAGMTSGEVEQAITEKLSKLMASADVTVVVSAINSKKIYIVGGVRREGPLAYGYRMTIMQAITEAGGPNEYAHRKKIYVLRTVGGKEYQLPFNYDEVIKGEKMEQNVALVPGDVIIVPR